MSTERQIRNIKISTNILIVLAFVGVFILPHAHAVFGIAEDNSTQVAWATQILTGPLNVITDTLNNHGEFAALWSACTGPLNASFTTAYNSLKVIGGLLALAIAMSHILDRIQKEADTSEAISRGLMEFFVTAFIIMNVSQVMDAMGAAGTDIAGYFSGGGVIDYGSVSAEELLKALTGDSTGGVLWRMEANVLLLIPWILSMLIVVATKFAIIQIMLEIIIRKLFAPIAIADIYHEGLRSPGMRYIKRYFGAYLKMAVCAAICMIIPSLMSVSPSGGETRDAFNYMFAIIAVNFASVAVMFKAGEYTNDIVGA